MSTFIGLRVNKIEPKADAKKNESKPKADAKK